MLSNKWISITCSKTKNWLKGGSVTTVKIEAILGTEKQKKSFKWAWLNKISKLKKLLAMISVLHDNGLEPIILYLFEVIKHFLKCAEFFVYACSLLFQYFRVYVRFPELLSHFLNALQLGHKKRLKMRWVTSSPLYF